MEYTVQKLGKLAGVSTRTLRYYDEIDILKPARINSSGYRIYGQKEVDRLQQIMFYREMGLELSAIKEILQSKDFDEIKALDSHLVKLLAQRQQLELLIKNVHKTIDYKKGMIQMRDSEKFEGFKQKLVDDNEEKYGKEIREKYSDEVVDESNQKMLNMTKEQYEEFEKLGQEILETLEEAFATKDPAGELGQKVAELHRKWLSYTWKEYTKEAHAGLAQMYVADERFTAYYDKNQPGLAAFLRDAILHYTGMEA
ncbi:MerR family transcriptional regulator [Konateibacter massiliensis]|uniref:MerR family transcriptional regulator n=1 Tax=Konateibacter massiliensis TaxID=2002841 RepID=UPI000C14529E|nr:MerR family transcriptional regulator [Konateibacter massiliensis]